MYLFLRSFVTTVFVVFSFLTFSQIPTDHLVAHYNFNNNFNDISGNNLNLFTTTPSFTYDRFGNNDGTYKVIDYNTYLHTDTFPELRITGDLSVSMWIKLLSYPQSPYYYHLINEYASGESLETNALIYAYINSTGTLYYNHEYGAGTTDIINSNYIVPLNEWVNIVFVRDTAAKVYKTYVDGTLYSTSTQYNQNPEIATNGNLQFLSIGNNSAGLLFSDIIFDDIRIYNDTLSLTEVTALYQERSNDFAISGYGNILNFDGTNSLKSDYTNNKKNDITYECWIKTSQNDNIIFGFWDGSGGGHCHDISINNNALQIYTYNGGTNYVNGNKTINDNKWHHIAVTIDATDTARIYIDGTLDSSGFFSTGAGQTFNLYVGRGSWNGVSYYTGKIDQLRIWYRTLSANEVQKLANNIFIDNNINTDSLMVWYNFDKIENDTVENFVSSNYPLVAQTNITQTPSTVPIIKYYDKGTFTDSLFAYDFEQNSLSYHIKTQPQTGNITVSMTTGHYSFNKTVHGNDFFTYYTVNSLGDTSNPYKIDIRDTSTYPVAGYGDAMVCNGNGCLNIKGFYLNDTISFAFWMKPNDIINNPVFSISAGGSNGRDDNVSIKIVNGKLLYNFLDNNGGSYVLNGKFDIKPNEWYHIYGSYEVGNKARIYVNGILDSEENANYPIKENFTAEPMVTIGATTDDNIYEYFDGEIDEFASWDTVFSSWDIQNLYMNTIYDGTEQNFLYGFHFDKVNNDTMMSTGIPYTGIFSASLMPSTVPVKLTTKKDYQANGNAFGYGQNQLNLIYHLQNNPLGTINLNNTTGDINYQRNFYGGDSFSWYITEGTDTSNVYTMEISPKLTTGDIIPESVTAFADTIEIMSNLFVSNNTTLTILDDTYVKTHEDCGIYVFGRILAQGSDSLGIIFTAADTTNFQTHPYSTTGGWRGIRFSNTPTANDTSIFDYCTISNGKAIADSSTNQANGGGLYVYSFDKVKILNSTIKNNYALNCGGGICALNSKIIIDKCNINNNKAFGQNTETWAQSGGGIYLKTSKGYISNTKISYNYCKYGGGAINAYGNGTNLYLTNCLIYKNVSTSNAGGIMSLYGDTIHIINSTIVQNLNAGLRGDHNNEYKIINSIISNNTGSEVWFWESDSTQRIIKYSLIENGDVYIHQTNNGLSSEGNIISNPEFINTNNNNYHLQQTSPCINAGNPTWTTDSIGFDYDLDGTDRILSLIVDMGCYESNAPVIDTIIVTNTTCGDSSGTAIIQVSGGYPPYSYVWSNGDTLTVADTLWAGNYSVQVTDTIGNIVNGYFSVNDIGGPSITIDSVTDVTCNGYNNGAINITATGVALPLSYSWSNGATSEDLNNLLAGTYMIEVSDTNNCKVMETIIVSEPSAININYTSGSAHCGMNDGSIYLNVSGGTNPYSYQWNTGNTTSYIDTLVSGLYNVSVNDANGCYTNMTIAVSDSSGPIITIDSTYSSFCGANEGAIFASINGGTLPYDTIYWSNGITDSLFIDSVDVGTYSLVVVDSIGCVGNIMAEVPVIQPLEQPICMVTVDSITGKNLLVWEKIQSSGISHYNIYRKVINSFMLVDSVPYDSLSIYIDTVADPSLYSWSYKISAVDFCGNESPLSETHQTIHLSMNVGINGEVNLSWSNYQGFYYDRYYIYRITNTGVNLLYTLGFGSNACTDPNPPTGLLRYAVAVEDTSGNPCMGSKAGGSGGPYTQSVSNIEDNGVYVTSINKILIENNIIIYPNPAKKYITVLSDKNNMQNIEIIDITGKLIINKTAYSKQQYNIDVSLLPSGIYLIKVITTKKTFVKKLIIE